MANAPEKAGNTVDERFGRFIRGRLTLVHRPSLLVQTALAQGPGSEYQIAYDKALINRLAIHRMLTIKISTKKVIERKSKTVYISRP